MIPQSPVGDIKSHIGYKLKSENNRFFKFYQKSQICKKKKKKNRLNVATLTKYILLLKLIVCRLMPQYI